MGDTLGPRLLWTAFTLCTVSTIIVALRFYSRYFRAGALRSYDFMMGVALAVTWGIATINWYQVKFGTGVHMADMPQASSPAEATYTLEGTLKSWYVYQLVYLSDLFLIKLSILCFYLALTPSRPLRICIFCLIAVIAAFTVAMVLVNAFECPRPSDAWSAEILLQGSGSCKDLRPIYFGQAGFNILSDILIWALPLPMLSRLHMAREKKIGLLAVFSVGFFAVVASAVRVYALSVWARYDDVPYAGAWILLWSQIELNTAIISASIPSLRPLFFPHEGRAPETLPRHGYQTYGSGTGGTAGQKLHLQYDKYGRQLSNFSSNSAPVALRNISYPLGREKVQHIITEKQRDHHHSHNQPSERSSGNNSLSDDDRPFFIMHPSTRHSEDDGRMENGGDRTPPMPQPPGSARSSNGGGAGLQIMRSVEMSVKEEDIGIIRGDLERQRGKPIPGPKEAYYQRR